MSATRNGRRQRNALAQLLKMAPDEKAWQRVSFETHRDASGHLMQWSPGQAA